MPSGVRRMRRRQRQDRAHRRPLQCGGAQEPLSPAWQLPMLPTTPSPTPRHPVTPTPAPLASLTHPNATPTPLLAALAPRDPCRGPSGPHAVPHGPSYLLPAQDTLSPFSKRITTHYPSQYLCSALASSSRASNRLSPTFAQRGPGSALPHAQTLYSCLTSSRDQRISPQLLFSS